MKLQVEFKPQKLTVGFKADKLTTCFQNPITRDYMDRDPYIGDYEITPSGDIQILSTKNLRMTDDIKINAVPSNYGLITWNGSVITVS